MNSPNRLNTYNRTSYYANNGSVGFIWYPHIRTDSSNSEETLSEKKWLITKIKIALSQKLY